MKDTYGYEMIKYQKHQKENKLKNKERNTKPRKIETSRYFSDSVNIRGQWVSNLYMCGVCTE